MAETCIQQEKIDFKVFYDSKMFFYYCKTSDFYHLKDNLSHPKELSIIKAFVCTLNDIIRDNIYPKLKSKFVRDSGYHYMFDIHTKPNRHCLLCNSVLEDHLGYLHFHQIILCQVPLPGPALNHSPSPR